MAAQIGRSEAAALVVDQAKSASARGGASKVPLASATGGRVQKMSGRPMSAATKPPAASTHRNTKDNNFDRVMPRLSHTAPESVGAAIERCARALRAGRVHFGHGTANARDEAAELVFFVA